MACKLPHQLIAALLLFATSADHATAQNRDDNKIQIQGKTKSFVGALEFTPNTQLAQGYDRIRFDGYGYTDPLVDKQTWHGSQGAQAKGMLREAVLFFEWWVRGSTPIARYKFDWERADSYDVAYTNKEGKIVYKTINRRDLEKYPNLLKRFDYISPTNVVFEYTFHFGGIPDQDYWDFRKRYNIMEDLGSAGYSVSYTRQQDGLFILYKGLSRKEWTAPNGLANGWDDFLNFPDKHKDIKPRLLEIIRMSETLVMESFRIVKIEWPVKAMIDIAQKYEDYESGKDKPSAFDEVANAEEEKKAGSGFWDETDMVDGDTEPFQDPNTRKWGIKTKKDRVVKQAEYDEIHKDKAARYFIAKKSNTVFILSALGAVVWNKTYSDLSRIGAYSDKGLYVQHAYNSELVYEHEFRQYVDQYLNTWNEDTFYDGTLRSSNKYFDVVGQSVIYLIARSPGDHIESKEEVRAREERQENAMNEKIREAEATARSRGYKQK